MTDYKETPLAKNRREAVNIAFEKAAQMCEVLLRIGRVSSIPAAIRLMKMPEPK